MGLNALARNHARAVCRVCRRVGVGRRRSWILIVLPIASHLACSGYFGGCDDYACVNSASMTGEVEISDNVMSVDVEYCSERGCTGGLMDVGKMNQTTCNDGMPGAFDDGVCIRRTVEGKLEVEAALTRPDNGKLPADGESYSLEIIDHDSGEDLLHVRQEADYVKTRQDECHLCWKAEMTF